MKRDGLGLEKHFKKIKDPRRKHKRLHKLIDIIFIGICAVLSGADSFVAMEKFGKAKKKWLKTFLSLKNGIPSHDTFDRVFRLLEPEALKEGFYSWIEVVMKKTVGEVIAIDGKTVRRSFDKVDKKSAIHVVSAWANENRLVLGQVKVREKSNEITAIPALLNLLAIEGNIITIDAIGAQKSIAELIIDRKADYILALKDNQKTLAEDVRLLLEEMQKLQDLKITYDYDKTVEKAHGRIEIRECYATSDIDWLANKEKWKGLQTVVMIRSTRIINEETSVENRYYLASLPPDAKLLLKSIRDHWGVENSLHWVLDIAFREDESRVRKDHAPENLNLLRHLTLNLLRQDTSTKVGINIKRQIAGWDTDYLSRILSHF